MNYCEYKTKFKYICVKFINGRLSESDKDFITQNSKSNLYAETFFDKDLEKYWYSVYLGDGYGHSININNGDYIVIHSEYDVQIYRKDDFNKMFIDAKSN
jgi:hypothetical protein